MSQQIDELFDVFEDTATIFDNDSKAIEADTVELEREKNENFNEIHNGKKNNRIYDNNLSKESPIKNGTNENYHTDGINHFSDIKDEENNLNVKGGKNQESTLDNIEDLDNFNIRLVVGEFELEKAVSERVKSIIYNEKKKNDDAKNNSQFREKIRKLKDQENEDDIKTKNNNKEIMQGNEYRCADIRDLLIEEHPINYSRTLKDGDSLIMEEFFSDTNCIHKCVRPKQYVHKILNEPIIPARTYKFKLDTFQRKSIECLERSESVLVSAHTSAGKTVIAEYAIALGLRDKQRVIYTSPIKALSNQKYRDLHEEFEDVGLITGDISINPDASVIVMTTEILRSMLYRGAALTKEVRWVIFDEIHYMRDRDRGVIWEETIILLPLMVRFIFLSATIPNGIQFAEWVSTIKSQACHIIYTDYRPTPLQHYIYPTGKESVILICDEHGQFLRDNFVEAVNAVNSEEGNEIEENQMNPNGNKKTNRNANKNFYKMEKRAGDIEKIVKMCHARHYTPLIVFAFSKKECEMNANSISKIDLTDASEKAIINELFKNAVQILSDDDRNLPQIKCILPLLLRGIGIHHGGLLPIIKEIIEIMFQESLLKVLFSTETFSMGINMPAKTVVFTTLEKFDGVEKRTINSGEYIQMAGRAGRRGLDDRGIVIIILDKYIHWEDAERLFIGKSNSLNSQFHLGYNMILNLLRIEGITPDYMIERSFMQYQTKRNMYEQIAIKKKIDREINLLYSILNNIYVDEKGQEVNVESSQRLIHNILKQIKEKKKEEKKYMEKEEIEKDEEIEKEVERETQKKEAKKEQMYKKESKLESISLSEENVQTDISTVISIEKLNNCTSVFSCVSHYYSIKKKLVELGRKYRYFLTQQKVITPFLCKGRLVFIEEKGIVWGWCVFIEGRIIRDKRRKINKSSEEGTNSINGVYGNKAIKNKEEKEDVVVIDCWVPQISDKKRKLCNQEQKYMNKSKERKLNKENISTCGNITYDKYKIDGNGNRQNNITNINDTHDVSDIKEESTKRVTMDNTNIFDAENEFDVYGCNELNDLYCADDLEYEKENNFLFREKDYPISQSNTQEQLMKQPYKRNTNVMWKQMTFPLSSVYRLSAAILSVPPDVDLKSDRGMAVIKERYDALMEFVKHESLLPIINIKKLNMYNKEIVKVLKNIKYCEQLLLNNILKKNKKFNKFYLMYLKYVALQCENNEVDSSILKCRNIVLKKELKKMLHLMENMKYIEVTHRMKLTQDGEVDKQKEVIAEQKQKEEEVEIEKTKEKEKTEAESTKEGETLKENEINEVPLFSVNSLYEHLEMTKNNTHGGIKEKGYVVTIKGQIASAISSVDELVIAELFFANFFSKYGTDYVAAFLSCFVFDENKTAEVPITDKTLVEGHKIIIETAKHIAREMEKCGMSVNLNEYLDKFKPEIMSTVLNWMRGYPFSKLQADSNIYEGSIIRTLRRLDELLRQMICAFRGISNDQMCEILLSASKTLRRGIPFSPSLYL